MMDYTKKTNFFLFLFNGRIMALNGMIPKENKWKIMIIAL